MKIVSCIAPVNIAVIKYWGKRDETLILPLNDSISVTLSTEQMHAKTSIMASPEFKSDRMWLNGKEQSLDNPRLQNCLKKLRKQAEDCCGDMNVQSSWGLHICSQNNFPTAAGLASSAAGYACFVYTLAQLYGIEGDISALARLGSGSACRSVFGGFVRWHQGSAVDGSDSVATQIVPASHWPEMRVLILVVNDTQKKTSSTHGMQNSVETSTLLNHRIKHIVPERASAIEKAIKEKDFGLFAEITMKDSNQFHAICLDTYPPPVYMNDTSHTISHMVHRYNEVQGTNKVAYTFDAGPNACLFMLEPEVPHMLGLIDYIFPAVLGSNNQLKGISCPERILQKEIKNVICVKPQSPGQVQYLILTKIGEGPSKTLSEHLLDNAGVPRSV